MTHGEEDAYPVPATYEDRRFIRSNPLSPEKWAYMGFAAIDIDGARMHVRYIDENGRLDKTEEFV